MNWKVGDKFIDTAFLSAGIGTIYRINRENMGVVFENQEQGYQLASLSDESLVPLEIWNSPLYQTMREE